MADILFVSDGFFHPPWQARRHVRQIVAGIPGCRITKVRHLNALSKLDLARFQALVLYYHHKELHPAALVAFDRFVRQGGGVLALHSATASFKDQDRYFEILGGRFTGHGPVESFAVEPQDPEDKLFKGIGHFTVEDELYIHDLQPDIRVYFAAQHQEHMQPLVWTRREGQGRVCYIGPGHLAASMKQPPMEEIVRRGLAWVLSGDSQP